MSHGRERKLPVRQKNYRENPTLSQNVQDRSGSPGVTGKNGMAEMIFLVLCHPARDTASYHVSDHQ